MKKTIAIILTILMAASTFTACSQANGVAESSVDGSPETAGKTALMQKSNSRLMTQTSQNEAPVQQQKAESKAEEKPQTPQKPKTESTPKTTDKPKTQSKPQTEEKPVVTEQPKQQSIDFGRVTSALISYGCSLGMVYNGSLNTGNAGWFPPLDVSGYSDTDSVISAGYDEVGYLPYYFGSYAESGDIAFNVIASNNQIYVVYG